MRRCVQILFGAAATAAMTTAAVAQLQMQEQSVGAPRRSPPVYKPQSLDEPVAGGVRPGSPTPATPVKPQRKVPAKQGR